MEDYEKEILIDFDLGLNSGEITTKLFRHFVNHIKKTKK